MKYTPKNYLIILEKLADDYFFVKKLKKSTCLYDVAQIASDIKIIEDDYNNNVFETRDPGAWYEWLSAIDGRKEKITLIDGVCRVIEREREKELPKQKLTLKESYDAVMRFIKIYSDRFGSEEIGEFIRYLTFKKWQKACTEFSSNNPYTKNPDKN